MNKNKNLYFKGRKKMSTFSSLNHLAEHVHGFSVFTLETRVSKRTVIK